MWHKRRHRHVRAWRSSGVRTCIATGLFSDFLLVQFWLRGIRSHLRRQDTVVSVANRCFVWSPCTNTVVLLCNCPVNRVFRSRSLYPPRNRYWFNVRGLSIRSAKRCPSNRCLPLLPWLVLSLAPHLSRTVRIFQSPLPMRARSPEFILVPARGSTDRERPHPSLEHRVAAPTL